MIYYTGDIHRSMTEIFYFCNRTRPTHNDIIILLGDVGVNYFGNKYDLELKRTLSKLKPTLLCIHGNHEMRPEQILSYRVKKWNGGLVWAEPDFPNLLFAKDGEIYNIEGLHHLVIGGAYSVDKAYRLSRGLHWWPDEQPSAETKAYVEQQIATQSIDIVLSHTCPFKYQPVEAFLTLVDQNTVDTSTEHWLDRIEDRLKYKAWFCGHWHINKRIDKMHFLFHNFESSAQFMSHSDLQPDITAFTKNPGPEFSRFCDDIFDNG